MKVSFTIVTEPTDKPKHFQVGKQFKKYAGDYEVRELSAQEGIEAVDVLIAVHPEFQENPDQIKPEMIRQKQIEKATTFNGKPLVIEDLNTIPNKLWQLLVGANEILNSVSITEARFLLSPFGADKQPATPP